MAALLSLLSGLLRRNYICDFIHGHRRRKLVDRIVSEVAGNGDCQLVDHVPFDRLGKRLLSALRSHRQRVIVNVGLLQMASRDPQLRNPSNVGFG